MGDFTRSGLGLGLACIDTLGITLSTRDRLEHERADTRTAEDEEVVADGPAAPGLAAEALRGRGAVEGAAEPAPAEARLRGRPAELAAGLLAAWLGGSSPSPTEVLDAGLACAAGVVRRPGAR